MQLNKLKGKLVENGLTYQNMSEFLGISKTTFANKMQGKALFNANELLKIQNILKLSNTEIMDIFFSK